MKNFLRTMLAKAPHAAISFTAKSALIATTLAATGRAFAGGAPSGSGLLSKNIKKLSFTKTQSEVLKSIVIERLDSGTLSEEEAKDLQGVVEKLDADKTLEDEDND